ADPPDAGITILGEDGYRLPLRGPHIEQELPTGKYNVLVYRDNYLAHDLDVVIESHVTNTCRVTLPPIGIWAATTAASIQSVPVVANVDNSGLLAAIVGDNSGNVYCVAARSGIMKWVHQVNDAVQAPIAVTGSNVFIATTAGKLFCLAGNDGHEIWRKPFEAAGPVFGAIISRDVAGNGTPDVIVASGEGAVYAVSGATGTGLWTNTIDGRIESCVALGRVGTNEFVLVGSSSGTLAAFSLRRGELLWSVATETPLLLPPRFETLAGQPCVLLPTPKTPGDGRTLMAVSLTDHKVIGVNAEFPRRLDLTGTGQLQTLVVTETDTTCYDATGTNQVWQSDYLAIGAYTADMNGDGTLDLVFNNGPDEIVILSGNDGLLIGRIVLDAPTGRGFTLDDVDGDGSPDIVVGVAQNLRCFSLAGGRKCWARRSEGYFDAPFASADARFVTKDNAGEIACYDPQFSAPVWRVPTSPQPSPYFGVAAGEGVVVDSDANSRLVRAFSTATGAPLWQARLDAETTNIGAPSVGDGLAIVSDGVASVRAFSLSTGAARWSVRLAGVTTAPTIGGGRVIVTGMNDLYTTVTCLIATNGQTLWRTGFSDPVPTAPVLVDINGDGIPDVVALCDNGIIYALDGRDGTTLWLYRHSDRHTHTRNGITVSGRQCFFATSTGDVIGLDLRNGQPLWTHRLKEPVLGLPALANINGTVAVLIGTMKGRVHCLSIATGAALWSYEVGAPIRYGAPLVVKNPRPGAPLIIIGTGPPENGLYCLRSDCQRSNNRGWSGPWKEVTGP
ncbi:MAG: PQQ-binding-like beta-propeller repeat protein, partial [Verrucomicrobiota bacterium]